MKSIVSRLGLAVAAAAVGFAPAAQATGALVLSDSFTYASDAALIAGGWQTAFAPAPAFSNSYGFSGSGSGWISDNAANRPTTLTSQTLLALNNRATFRELGTTVTGDWEVTALVGMNAYSRSFQIGLADAAGAGYSLRWTGALPTQSLGNGAFTLRELTTWDAFTPNGAQLGGAVDGLSTPTRYALPTDGSGNLLTAIESGTSRLLYSTNSVFLGYSEIKLTWTAATGELRAFQDGTQLMARTDPTYSSFSRLYIGGGTTSYVDSVTVTAVPEASSLALVATVGLAGIGTWRLKRRAR